MKYFFLAYFGVALLVVGALGFRGDKFSQAPLEIFSDMDKPMTTIRRPILTTVLKSSKPINTKFTKTRTVLPLRLAAR